MAAAINEEKLMKMAGMYRRETAAKADNEEDRRRNQHNGIAGEPRVRATNIFAAGGASVAGGRACLRAVLRAIGTLSATGVKVSAGNGNQHRKKISGIEMDISSWRKRQPAIEALASINGSLFFFFFFLASRSLAAASKWQ